MPDQDQVNKNVISMDSDYAPTNSDIKLKMNTTGEKIKFILVYTTSDDPYTAIMEDTEDNRKTIEEYGLKIIGHGETDISIPELIYSLNHSSRIQYKSTINDLIEYSYKLRDRFTKDDKEFREILNNL